MKKMYLFVGTFYIFALIACGKSKHPLDRVSELKEGYRISTEKGWQLPADTVGMSEEQVLKLEHFDEAELSMNEFLFYTKKKLSADKYIVVWAKNNTADTYFCGEVYLSVTDKNLKALETLKIIDGYASEGGKFFDVFEFAADNRFTISRMINTPEGPDVVFRYEYQISSNGSIELQGQFDNTVVIEELNAERARAARTIFGDGLMFLNTTEPFIASEIPDRFRVSETMPGYSYELRENGATSISFIVVNNQVQEILIYSKDYHTEKDIRVGSTFSQLKNAYEIESVQCRPNDLGIWARIKTEPSIEFQLNLTASIRCNSDDEVPVSSVPDEVKITCVRVTSL